MELNRKLVLETPVRVADGAGGFTETWSPLGQLWAEVKPSSSRERMSGTVTMSGTPYKITVRSAPVGASARPRAEQRFREGTRRFRILGISDGDRASMYLTCHAIEEVVG